MTDTSPPPSLAESTWLPSGVTAVSIGKLPTGIVAVMVLVAGFSTETELPVRFGTYTVVPTVVAACADAAELGRSFVASPQMPSARTDLSDH
jgi:hypothetical protein